jgi:Spy/CpxP family protein refolding chaperone
MKYLMTAAALCLGILSAQAQTGKTGTTAPAARNCIASTTDKGWADLGLTAEQTTKVKEIQSESRKATDRLKADNMENKESPMLDKYEDEVKKVLTPAQYEKWVKECSTRAEKPAPEKNTMERSN